MSSYTYTKPCADVMDLSIISKFQSEGLEDGLATEPAYHYWIP